MLQLTRNILQCNWAKLLGYNSKLLGYYMSKPNMRNFYVHNEFNYLVTPICYVIIPSSNTSL